MKKYAVDLMSGDRIIPKHTDRVMLIEWITVGPDTLEVYGYFEDNGDDADRLFSYDSIVRMA